MKSEAFLQLLDDIQKADEMESGNIRAGFILALEAYMERLEEDATSMLTYASKSAHNAIQVSHKYQKTMEEIELLETWKQLYY